MRSWHGTGHRPDPYLRAMQDTTEPGPTLGLPGGLYVPREFAGCGWFLGSTAMLRTAATGQSLQVWKRPEEQEVLQ